MSFLDIYPIVLAVVFTFLIGWLLPKSGKSYDVFRLRLDLFPYWFKWLGAGLIVVSVCITLLLFRLEESRNHFLLANINFALFLILFSKERKEDEFSEQIRLKAFVYAFISFVAILIIYGALKGSKVFTSFIMKDDVFVLIFLGIALVSALSYFYTTKYLSNKKEI